MDLTRTQQKNLLQVARLISNAFDAYQDGAGPRSTHLLVKAKDLATYVLRSVDRARVKRRQSDDHMRAQLRKLGRLKRRA